jgi:hypothetical protein
MNGHIWGAGEKTKRDYCGRVAEKDRRREND